MNCRNYILYSSAHLMFISSLDDHQFISYSSDYLLCIYSSYYVSVMFIWSNFMRMHIGLKICHFLQSVVSITEGPKKIMRKSGTHTSVPSTQLQNEGNLKNVDPVCFLRLHVWLPLFSSCNFCKNCVLVRSTRLVITP